MIPYTHLRYQVQPLERALVLSAGRQQIYARRLYRAVAQHVRQPGYVPAHPVEGAGEQVPQVVGKDLAGFHSRLCTQSLHFRPDLPAGETGPVSDEKDLTGNGFVVALAKEIHQLCW